MSPRSVLLTFAGLLGSTTSAIAVDGWPDLFPSLGNYNKKITEPVVGKGDKPETYRQSATYSWLGGRFESITITLARDPKFKEKYAADVMKKDRDAKEFEVEKKTGYLWELTEGKPPARVGRRLVVILADDKVVILEQAGYGIDLTGVARKFLDLAKIEKALENPPPVAKEE